MTLEIKSATEEEEAEKILPFLSFQMDHRIAKGTNLHKTHPHPKKQPPNQDSMASTIFFRQHQARLHLPMKLFQTQTATLQWRKRWLTNSYLPYITQLSEKRLEGNPLLLRLSTMDTFTTTTKQQNTSTLGGVNPNQTLAKGAL